MRCRDCESLLTDGREALAGVALKRAFEAHLGHCPACRALGDDLRLMRAAAPDLAPPPLPAALERRVRAVCHEEMAQRERGGATRREAASLPGFFWPVFGALLVLTAAALIPGLTDFIRGGSWTGRTTLALVLVIQNFLMLVTAPLVLVRRPENGAACGQL